MVGRRTKNRLKIDHRCGCGWYVELDAGNGDSAWDVFERTLRAIKDHDAECDHTRAASPPERSTQ